MRYSILFPPVFAAFTFAACPVNAQNLVLSLQDKATETNFAPSNNVTQVDIHAVIMLDVSPSMKKDELQSAKKGIDDYLLSDISLEDYDAGYKKAITVVSFAGDSHLSQTYIIDSEVRAHKFIDNFIDRYAVISCCGITEIEMEDGQLIMGGTNLNQAMDQTMHVFRNEHKAGIDSERRVALVVGDYTPDSQKRTLRKQSDSLTNELGVQVCGVSVSAEMSEKPDYSVLTSIHHGYIETSEGKNAFITACNPIDAPSPKAVKAAVSNVLAMSRI